MIDFHTLILNSYIKIIIRTATRNGVAVLLEKSLTFHQIFFIDR